MKSPICSSEKTSPIQAVLFDFDGVLVDSMPYHVQAWQTVFNDFEIVVEPEDVLLMEGARSVELARQIFSAHGMQPTPKELQKFVDRKQETFRSIADITPDRHAVALVNKLSASHLRLGLVTGTARANVEQILGSALTSRFDVIVTGDDVRAGKPDPECFRKAAQAIGLAPEKCLVVENAPLGIQAARAANMIVVALKTTLPRHFLDGAHFYAKTPAELLTSMDDMIAELTGSSQVLSSTC